MKFVFLTMILLIPSGHATQTMTFRQVVETAQSNNAELRGQVDALNSKVSQEGVARGGFLPSVTGSLNYSRAAQDDVGGNSTPANNYSASVTAEQNLFSGFQDKSKFEQAKANTRDQESQLQITKAKISVDIKTAYENYMSAREFQNLNKLIVQRREENLRMVELQYEGGGENKGSVMLSKANLDQARFESLQAVHAEVLARADLAKVMGLDSDADFEITESIPLAEPTVEPRFNELAMAVPQHKQAVAKESSAYAGLGISRSTFFPTLNLIGSAGRLGPSYFPQQDGWSVGASISFPLFNGGRDYYGYKSTAYDLSTASQNRVTVDRTLLSSLRQTYYNYTEAVMQMKINEDFQKAALVRAVIARKKYSNGLLIFEEWDNIENDLIDRQKKYLTSKKARIINEALWEQAQGKGVIQ